LLSEKVASEQLTCERTAEQTLNRRSAIELLALIMELKDTNMGLSHYILATNQTKLSLQWYICIMEYTFRRVCGWNYDILKGEKRIAFLLRGSGYRWHIFKADSSKDIATNLQNLKAAKEFFVDYSTRRRGHL